MADDLEQYKAKNIPDDLAQYAAKAAAPQTRPQGNAAPKPGFLSAVGQDIGPALKGLGMAALGPVGMSVQALQKAQESYDTYQKTGQTPEQAQAESEKAAGHGPIYRYGIAPLARGIGVNVPGMEAAAEAGSVGGVLGHAAVPAAAAAAPLAIAHGVIPAIREASAPPMVAPATVDEAMARATAPAPVHDPHVLQSVALKGVPQASGLAAKPAAVSGDPLATVGLPAGEKAALKSFRASTPSALGKIPVPEGVKPEAKPVEAKPPLPEGRVSGPEGVAKIEAPKAKPVEAPSASERRSRYLFGEHAKEYDPENLAHRKIKDMTYDELVKAANERKYEGRSDWSVDELKRTKEAHGKSSNPVATGIRGMLLKEAK